VRALFAASANHRRVVLALAAVAYAAVFAAFVLLERPGLGLGHFFYVPICLVALVTDGAFGTLAGVLAALLYAVAVEAAPGVPSTDALTKATVIRLVTFTIVGGLIGMYAGRNRHLVESLRDHASRDFVTGLGNARAFDDELARRCASGTPFALVLADVDDLKDVNDIHGHAAGNAVLKRVGQVLRQHIEPGDFVARLGGDEFALVTSLPPEQIAALAARVNRTLSVERFSVTFGSTFCPADGQTATELFHKADDRLFAAKLVRHNRATVVALATAGTG
jgi:diguanylate cyclase (GGDEF)-like protein